MINFIVPIQIIGDDGKPYLCLFATKKIERGQELRYSYGDETKLWWRKNVSTLILIMNSTEELSNQHEYRKKSTLSPVIKF